MRHHHQRHQHRREVHPTATLPTQQDATTRHEPVGAAGADPAEERPGDTVSQVEARTSPS